MSVSADIIAIIEHLNCPATTLRSAVTEVISTHTADNLAIPRQTFAGAPRIEDCSVVRERELRQGVRCEYLHLEALLARLQLPAHWPAHVRQKHHALPGPR